MIPHVGSELVAADERWRHLVDNVATVPTQAAQLWLTESEAELGWPAEGATLSGWDKPFDTYSSMSHLLPLEDWPAADAPRGLAYLCSSLPDEPGHDQRSVRAALEQVLDERMSDLWPLARGPHGFRRAVLHGGIEAQFVTAAIDPSDRYVQSLPGTNRYRLRVDESGLGNLVLAGDWTNCGLNAGCIEAAVLSGLEAANTILDKPLMDGVLGTWYPVGRADDGVDNASSQAGATATTSTSEAAFS
jgi:Flavin containing amine oxidoreductase